jgi:hypothetical protein
MQVKQNDMGYMIDWLGSLRCTGWGGRMCL